MIHHFWPLGYEINWALAGQITVGWIIISVIATPMIADLLHNLRTKREFEGHLARERRRVRLEKKLELVDELDAAQTNTERQRIFRKAEALGFVVTEQDKDWEGPFMLDEDMQPHSDPPRAA